ncbi:hypothetical protein OGAPHI_002856 [Ogataea philodendri]|uniref:Uncharacterized protein n=1 Tax=Ogataea philodendri TaxID=1378263 RepID=A0A9P8P8G6_9ASCO|nr:uncharacterized protein OGAPHI_002856 [Ogataea philodendri]KAH3667207.1 hypothetical protein OGAPHI_002856 [Ogataea philodendri]
MTLSESKIVWKCFVFPGVEETDTFLDPTNALMVEDLPTFGYPTSPICNLFGCPSGGSVKGSGATFKHNSSSS